MSYLDCLIEYNKLSNINTSENQKTNELKQSNQEQSNAINNSGTMKQAKSVPSEILNYKSVLFISIKLFNKLKSNSLKQLKASNLNLKATIYNIKKILSRFRLNCFVLNKKAYLDDIKSILYMRIIMNQFIKQARMSIIKRKQKHFSSYKYKYSNYYAISKKKKSFMLLKNYYNKKLKYNKVVNIIKNVKKLELIKVIFKCHYAKHLLPKQISTFINLKFFQIFRSSVIKAKKAIDLIELKRKFIFNLHKRLLINELSLENYIRNIKNNSKEGFCNEERNFNIPKNNKLSINDAYCNINTNFSFNNNYNNEEFDNNGNALNSCHSINSQIKYLNLITFNEIKNTNVSEKLVSDNKNEYLFEKSNTSEYNKALINKLLKSRDYNIKSLIKKSVIFKLRHYTYFQSHYKINKLKYIYKSFFKRLHYFRSKKESILNNTEILIFAISNKIKGHYNKVFFNTLRNTSEIILKNHYHYLLNNLRNKISNQREKKNSLLIKKRIISHYYSKLHIQRVLNYMKKHSILEGYSKQNHIIAYNHNSKTLKNKIMSVFKYFYYQIMQERSLLLKAVLFNSKKIVHKGIQGLYYNRNKNKTLYKEKKLLENKRNEIIRKNISKDLFKYALIKIKDRENSVMSIYVNKKVKLLNLVFKFFFNLKSCVIINKKKELREFRISGNKMSNNMKNTINKGIRDKNNENTRTNVNLNNTQSNNNRFIMNSDTPYNNNNNQNNIQNSLLSTIRKNNNTNHNIQDNTEHNEFLNKSEIYENSISKIKQIRSKVRVKPKKLEDIL